MLQNRAERPRGNMKNRADTILIGDRNPRVRMFLERELGAAGFHVIAVPNSRELMRRAFGKERIDLVILDPDFPGETAERVLERLLDRIPVVPIIVHSFLNHNFPAKFENDAIIVVEKGGGSIDRLKEIAQQVRNRAGEPPPDSTP
jgi:DNA-binding NtrC family response regulator